MLLFLIRETAVNRLFHISKRDSKPKEPQIKSPLVVVQSYLLNVLMLHWDDYARKIDLQALLHLQENRMSLCLPLPVPEQLTTGCVKLVTRQKYLGKKNKSWWKQSGKNNWREPRHTKTWVFGNGEKLYSATKITFL